MVMRVRVALVFGLTLVAVAVVLVLSQSPARVIATNSISIRADLASYEGSVDVCQGNEAIPQGASAVRVALEAIVGPPVVVTVRAHDHLVTRGARGSGWTGGEVTVPLGRVPRATGDATLCLAIGRSREVITMLGAFSARPARVIAGGSSPPGRIRVEYLAAGSRSWWSLALSVTRRIGLGRAPSGTWVVLLPILLMAAVVTLMSYVCVRELNTRKASPADRRATGRGRRIALALSGVPTAAWICALVACCNAVCWSILSPPLQGIDETAHFAYVQQLAEAHQLPVKTEEPTSPEEETAIEDLHQREVRFLTGNKTISSRSQERKLEHDLAQPLARRGSGNAEEATTEPPLYYALETIPYELASSGSLLDRLALMRLFSALFGGLTALFAYLFVREALPGIPWAWTVGGLGVALAPLLGFISGAVNPDAMLYAVSAVLFYLLANAFRRGLTFKLAAAIGITMAIGILTKLNFLALIPGAVLGLAALSLKASPITRRARLARLSTALSIAASPALFYIAASALADHESLSFVSNVASTATQGLVLKEISYIWQLYLPPLAGMTNYFPGVFTLRQLWFDGLVGLYGWADTVFPGWADNIALALAIPMVLLCLRALVACRAALRRRAVELLVYAAMGGGVLVLVGVSSYVSDVRSHAGPFWEPRYLLPMLPLLGAALALAARGAGRRWGPAAGALIVVLFLGHDVFSQLLLVSRYYG